MKIILIIIALLLFIPCVKLLWWIFRWLLQCGSSLIQVLVMFVWWMFMWIGYVFSQYIYKPIRIKTIKRFGKRNTNA